VYEITESGVVLPQLLVNRETADIVLLVLCYNL